MASTTRTRPSPRASKTVKYPGPKDLSGRRLELLRDRITGSILRAAGSPTDDDDLLGEIVNAAMHAFVESHAHAAVASDSVAHLMEQIGARQARSGFDTADLSASFRAALVTTQKSLTLVVGDLVTHDTLVQLRERLVTYLSELHIHAHAGLVRASKELSDAADSPKSVAPLRTTGKMDHSQPMIAVVSVLTAIPETLRHHPSAVSGNSRTEILVPSTWDETEIAGHLTGQAIIGPAAMPLQFDEILSVTRQAAELVRSGTVRDARAVIPCNDLLAALVVQANPILAQLAIEKHLDGLRHMAPRRRVAAAELLLSVLNNGQVMAAAARELGVPRQTVFSRMKPLRGLVGAALDDPGQCLELTVALQAALPLWREEATVCGTPSERYR